MNEGIGECRLLHNEEVARNRQFLRHHVMATVFLCCQALSFRDLSESHHNQNRGNYIELMSLIGHLSSDISLRNILKDDELNVFTGLSSDIQNDLIECVYSEVMDEIKTRVSDSPYLALIIDDSTSSKSQMSISLRLSHKGSIYEHLIDIVDVPNCDRTASVLAEKIIQSLKNKVGFTSESSPILISQSFDGTPVMAGKQHSVQDQILKLWPRARFVHCHAHKWPLVAKQACEKIDEVMVFFGNLQAVAAFFRASPERAHLLAEVISIPNPNRWLSRGKCVHTICSNYGAIKDVLSSIQCNKEFDAVTRNEAKDLVKKLKSIYTVFLLHFFQKVFALSDLVQTKLQSQNINPADLAEKVADYKSNLTSLRSASFFQSLMTTCRSFDPVFPREQKSLKRHIEDDDKDACTVSSLHFQSHVERLKQMMLEIIDCLIDELDSRFDNIVKLNWIQLFDSTNFAQFKDDALTVLELITELTEQHPEITKDKDLFSSQLQVLYAAKHVHIALENSAAWKKNVKGDKAEECDIFTLLKAMHELELVEVLPDVYKALVAALTIAITSVEERNFSVLRRIKHYKRSVMDNTRLSQLMTLAVENQLLRELSTTLHFTDRVIDKFAAMKERQVKLFFKK